MRTIFFCLTSLLIAGHGLAQGPEQKPAEQKFYRLDFAIKELEGGKVQKTRNYSTPIQLGGKSSIRMGDRVQVATDVPGKFSMLDVGVNIDASLVTVISGAADLHLTASIDDAVAPDKGPILSQTRWNTDVVVPLKKPTNVFSSDGAASRRQLQFEVTLTPIQ